MCTNKEVCYRNIKYYSIIGSPKHSVSDYSGLVLSLFFLCEIQFKYYYTYWITIYIIEKNIACKNNLLIYKFNLKVKDIL